MVLTQLITELFAIVLFVVLILVTISIFFELLELGFDIIRYIVFLIVPKWKPKN